MRSLDSPEKRSLLNLARGAVMTAVEGTDPVANPSCDVASAGFTGAFVTLRYRSQLRGCIGEINSKEDLVTVIPRCARAAALDDPRFRPVRRDELAEIKIDISILSPPRESKAEEIEPGKHGVIVSRGSRRGVLLPQVAMERGWGAQRFLEEACVKAGLEREAWKTRGVMIETFTAETFGETDSQIDGGRNPPDRLKAGYSIST
ncbi:MAG TPA: AmmeMemoRadiSam system protein A [Phototrophicaceae bacterium]|nr:AmmeMemoRadiSam system protein A [Verrucomicrobiae bacterium]HZH83314.1 AmmeMemoRadiSam system protein A [Phototrophicaceae bacterium]